MRILLVIFLVSLSSLSLISCTYTCRKDYSEMKEGVGFQDSDVPYKCTIGNYNEPKI